MHLQGFRGGLDLWLGSRHERVWRDWSLPCYGSIIVQDLPFASFFISLDGIDIQDLSLSLSLCDLLATIVLFHCDVANKKPDRRKIYSIVSDSFRPPS